MKKAILFILLPISIILSLSLGAQKISLADLISIEDNISKTIFLNLRLPRTILCVLAGGLLAVGGAVFQIFFRNPLSEPGIMGISAGATLGAVSSVCLFSSIIYTQKLSLMNFGAFCGALLSGIIISTLSGKSKASSVTTILLLCGTSLGTLYSAITSIMLSMNSEKISSMYVWMIGSFSGRGWTELMFILPAACLSIILFAFCSARLDILACGEISASNLGLNVSRLRTIVLVAGALSTSAAVCAGGTIGFVGLIAPHIVRRIYGVRAKVVIPLSAVMGAVIMTLSDTLCRIIIPPTEIPVGTVTAVMGVPFFISLLMSKRGLQNE